MTRRWAIAAALLLACGLPASGARVQPQAMKSVLPDGLVLVVKPNTATDIVSVHAFVRIPAVVETRRAAGIRQLLTQMLVRGTTQRSGSDLTQLSPPHLNPSNNTIDFLINAVSQR